MRFEVLNPDGRDGEQDFSKGNLHPRALGHPPINYHAYAACSFGAFHKSAATVPKGAVLVLLRKRNLRHVLSSIELLRKRGCIVFISLKESGAHQVAETLGDVTRWELFCQICSNSDGALSSTSELVSLYSAAGSKNSFFIPTPYPVDLPLWDFGIPLEARRGIFVGTREFGVPSRNHLEAVALANDLSCELKIPIAVLNSEGRRGGMILKTFQRRNLLFYIIEAPLAYKDYLELMRIHRVVWQLDSSAVPGQVAGDALLCRMPCIGGNGAIDRLAFPQLSSPLARTELLSSARLLLTDDQAWRKAVESSQSIASTTISFQIVSERLKKINSTTKSFLTSVEE
ncbi:MAG: hypothetical protein WCG52_01315 [bacterium]